MSPSVSTSARLQSIMPAPVWSRRALTSFALMLLTSRPRSGLGCGAAGGSAAGASLARLRRPWPSAAAASRGRRGPSARRGLRRAGGLGAGSLGGRPRASATGAGAARRPARLARAGARAPRPPAQPRPPAAGASAPTSGSAGGDAGSGVWSSAGGAGSGEPPLTLSCCAGAASLLAAWRTRVGLRRPARLHGRGDLGLGGPAVAAALGLRLGGLGGGLRRGRGLALGGLAGLLLLGLAARRAPRRRRAAASSASLRACSSCARKTAEPSPTTSPIELMISAHERIASSLPGMTYSMPSGSQFVSTRPMIGIRRRCASRTAISSTLRSMTTIAFGGRVMFFDAAEVRAQLREVGERGHALARRQQRELAVGLVALEVVQALDALVDRLEVRQQAAEPAVVDVRHAGLLGRVLDRVAGLLLRADEQHGAALVGDVATRTPAPGAAAARSSAGR